MKYFIANTNRSQSTGYRAEVFDRQWLLQRLYDSLQFKDRVLLGKRVAHISHNERYVEVTTDKGDVFRGTMVVGADGIHSVVRREMHRIGHNLQPGYFPVDEDSRVPCYFLLIFGISEDVPQWVQGDCGMVVGDEISNFYVSGPNGRVYWIMFYRLPEVKYGKDVPKCTKEMEDGLVQRYWESTVTSKVTFGHLYSKRTFSTLTPLHEYTYKRWFFKRMVTIGDSAHKVSPHETQFQSNRN